MMKNLVLFDFCETLVSFQSADAFVKYFGQKKCHTRWLLFNFYARVVDFLMFKILGIKKSYGKSIKLKTLSGFTRAEIRQVSQQFHDEQICPNLISDTMIYLKEHLAKADRVIIVSAGYYDYLQFFTNQFGIELVCTNLAYKNDICQGAFETVDCIGEEKITFLQKTIDIESYDRSQIVVYSDSVSDLPLFNLADQTFVVLNKKSHKSLPAWIDKHQPIWW